MLKKGWISIFLLISATTAGIGQAYNFKVDALAYSYKPLKVLRASYEQIFYENYGLLLTVEQGKYGVIKEVPQNSLTDTKETIATLRGWGFMAQARYYYYMKEGFDPHGFFGGIHYKYRKVKEEYIPLRINSSAIIHNIGINVGYKYCYTPLTFEFLIGYGIPIVKWFEPNQRDLILDKKFDLGDFKTSMRIELTVGIMLDYILRQD
jgi:hypothetical protein